MSDDFAPMKPPPRRRVRMRCVGWYGAKPKRGDYLCSGSPRARMAYRVLLLRWKWNPERGGWVGPLWALRTPIAEIPADAVVHRWNVVPRAKRRRVASLNDLAARA